LSLHNILDGDILSILSLHNIFNGGILRILSLNNIFDDILRILSLHNIVITQDANSHYIASVVK
jgi:hypothetical protein